MKRREAATTAHMEAGAGLRPPGVGAAFTLCAEDHPDSQDSGGTCQEGALKAIKHLSMASTPTATELKASRGRRVRLPTAACPTALLASPSWQSAESPSRLAFPTRDGLGSRASRKGTRCGTQSVVGCCL